MWWQMAANPCDAVHVVADRSANPGGTDLATATGLDRTLEHRYTA